MREALAEAAAAAVEGDVPVGCVIVKDDEIVGRGANEIQRTKNPTRHAEIVAIEEATRTLGEKFLEDCTLYVTLEPCAMCAGAIILSRIPLIVYGAADEKTGAIRSVFELADDPRLNHRCTVRTGILEHECSSLLTTFFRGTTDSSSSTRNDTSTGSSSSTRNDNLQVSFRSPERSPEGSPKRSPEGSPERSPSGLKAKLCLVATPIGNLDDITKRALQTLRDADVVLCEDTRRTGQLMRHYGIAAKKLVSNHEHNEQERAAWVVSQIEQGRTVAMVSDAGMPAISDPGYRTVAACVAAGVRVEALPGPSALISAVAASGLPTDEIYFAGFPPQKKGRQSFLTRVLASEATIVLYESPYRIQTLIDEIAELGGSDRRVVIAREISKMHEEYLRGTASDLSALIGQRGGLKGECVVVIEGSRSS